MIKACPSTKKMSVGRVYQVFQSKSELDDENDQSGIQNWHPCDSIVTFINHIAQLIHVFSSRNGLLDIKNNNDCPEKKVIEEFLPYLNLTDFRNFCSSNTILGLRVTCAVTLDLSKFLPDRCNYNFMLSKINQDNLEARIH